jgi:PEGA domain
MHLCWYQAKYLANKVSGGETMSMQSTRRVTRHFIEIAVLSVGLLAAQRSFAQAEPAMRASDAGRAGQPNCVILERMGAVGQVTSRVLSLGVRGSEFQFVEGKLPEGVTFHNKLTERDVRNLQASGANVTILDSDYMPDALMSAREGCLKAKLKATTQPSTAQIEIASSPAGSDIEIDGKFVGSTPSLVKVPAGEHTVRLTKDGYAAWERTLTTMATSVRISPDLQPVAPATASTEQTTTNVDTVANNRF